MVNGETMDLTERYIRMCMRAKEIQVIRDGWSSDYLGEIWILPSGSSIITQKRTYIGKMCTWVPRADQLKDIINFSYRDEKHVDELRLFILGYEELDTMEKIWLAFVMHKKYHKYWDDRAEEWVAVLE